MSAGRALRLPPPPPLGDGELHVWTVALDRVDAGAGDLEGCLSADERDRAARLRSPRERDRYRLARGVLRHLLAAYLNLPPEALTIEYGARGKPALAGFGPPPALHFNVSHSGELALYALSRRPVGVDLERVRPVRNAERIAERVFPAAERESWLALSGPERTLGFFARWTRLEALAKLHGDGVWSLVRTGGRTPEHATLVDLRAPPGHVAAAAVDGPVRSIQERSLEPA